MIRRRNLFSARTFSLGSVLSCKIVKLAVLMCPVCMRSRANVPGKEMLRVVHQHTFSDNTRMGFRVSQDASVGPEDLNDTTS